MNFKRDFLLAKRLQKEFNEEAKRRKRNENNTNRPNHLPQKPYCDEKMALIDPKLEYVDPNPDIHALFLHFDKLFFWKKLEAVEVKWSPRMTSCAGICCYQGRGGLCSIRLSLPLLKLRPRKDLVETLLHEMIHAYLFVTHNNRDRDGHGPEFHKHMNRINQSAGTKITVYHTFHDEVRSYQQHWWKCQGPCQKRPPYFGMVRRAMNRAPGPSDFWWSDHQASCGGIYVKVREPEGYSSSKKGKGGKTINGKGKTVPSQTELPRLTAPKKIEKPSGFGIGGGEVRATPKSGIYGYFSPIKSSGEWKPSSKVGGLVGTKSSHVTSLVVTDGSKTSETSKSSINKPFIPFSGKGQVLGGGNSVQRPTFPKQHLSVDTKGSPGIKKDLVKRNYGTCDSVSVSPVKRPRNAHVPSISDSIASSSSYNSSEQSFPSNGHQVKCPVCNSLQYEATINAHLDDCIASQSKSADDDVVCLYPPPSEESWYLECPGCRDKVRENEFDNHLNACERICGGESHPGSLNEGDSCTLSSDDDAAECPSCPICGQSFTGALGTHLDTCLSSMSFDEGEDWN